MFVGECPGQHEDEQLKPFVGPAGIVLNRTCIAVGQPNWRAECYVTNVAKYRPPENDFRRISEVCDLEAEIAFFWEEVKTINPNIIVVLGKNAYTALGIYGTLDTHRGSILSFRGRKVIATYHPARFLYAREAGQFSWKPFEKAIFQFDIQRAFTESGSRDLNLPKRNNYIVEDSNKLIQFITRWESRRDRIAEDIESINHIPFCLSLCFDPSESISIPLFDHPYGKVRGRKDVARLWYIIDKLNNNRKFKIIGQNFKYDEPKLKKLGLTFWKIHSDTSLKGHVICPEFPRNLAFLTSINTRQPYYKNDYAEFKAGKTSIESYMLYNAMDGAVTNEIDLAQEADLEELGLTEFYYEFEMRLHELYSALEETGFACSEEVRHEIIDIWTKKVAATEIELFKLTGMHLNTASNPQVKLAFVERMKLPFRKSYDENSITAILGNHAKKPEQKRFCKLVLQNRKDERLLSTTIASPTDYDGRMRTSVFIPATETRRTADYLLDSPIRPIKMGIGFKTMSKHGEAGIVRKMIVPDKGYVFINFDQSQAEARVCSLLADDEDALTSFDTIDIHALTASWTFGGKWEDWSKARLGYECPERFIGKTLRHAGHLDMQKHTCMQTINTDAQKFDIDIEISEYKANELLKVFHKYTPRIREVFHKGIQDALLRDAFFLSGSSPCVGKNWFPKRQFFGDWDRDLWKEAYAFIPQQSVTDKTKWILLHILDNYPWLRICGESHDAGLLLCPDIGSKIDEAYDIIKAFGEQPIDFSSCSIPRRNLVIPIDVEIGRENYKELKKYKRIGKELRTETCIIEPSAEDVYKSLRGI